MAIYSLANRTTGATAGTAALETKTFDFAVVG